MKPMSPETMFDVITLGFFWINGGQVGSHRTVKTILRVLRKCEVWGNYEPSKDRDLVILFQRRTAVYPGAIGWHTVENCGSHFAARVSDSKSKAKVISKLLVDVPLYLTPKGAAYASRAAARRAEYVTKEQFMAAWDALQQEWSEVSEAGRLAMFEAGRRSGEDGQEPL